MRASMVMHACMGPSSAMDCYTACSRVLGSWSFVGMFLVLGQGERPSANDSMQSQQKIESIHACVHGDARAMWVARSDYKNQMPRARVQQRLARAEDQGPRAMAMQDSCTKNKVHRKPRARDQGPRAKEQEARTKSQGTSLCHAWTHTCSQVSYIYIYICIYIHASLRDPNFPSSRLPYIVPDFHAGLRSFNFPDSQILSDKLSDPNLTPFPNPMHARIKYFARSHCCKDKCTFTKT